MYLPQRDNLLRLLFMNEFSPHFLFFYSIVHLVFHTGNGQYDRYA